MPAPITFSSEVIVNVPAETIWPLVSDTDRLNRVVGLPQVQYETTPDPAGGARRKAHAKIAVMSLRWEEMPFEWVRNEGFSVERNYASGPFEKMVAGCTLDGLDGGKTSVGIFGHFTPRNALGVVLAHLIGRKSLRDLAAEVRHLSDCADGKSRNPYARSGGKNPLNEEALLTAAVAMQDDLKKKILGKFFEYLKDAYDEDLIRMRPFALADQWGEERMDVLRTFLSATKAGVLEMKWVPICPHCRGAKGEVATLKDLKKHGYCDGCNISFDVNFDEAVEVRFTVHPSLRPTVDAVYCIGGPANTRHILCQVRIPSGETRAVSVAARPDRYRIRSPQVKGACSIEWVESSDARKQLIIARPEGFLPESLLYSGERVELEVTNSCGSEILFILEEEAPEAKAASAALVTSLQDFRDLFNAEVISAGNEISIRSLAILFSDLKSSTELYEKVGDARAYALVHEHFEFMADRIRMHNGAIVKTIGDAVMAVFTSGKDAVATCLEIQANVGEFNKRENLCSAICLKLGVHKGPVIAVNSNDMLDYFGATVNVAARLQAESIGGDIVLSQALYEDPEIARMIAESRSRTEDITANLKGVAQTHRLKRVWVKSEIENRH